MTDDTKNKENFLMPTITDLKSAQSAAQQGTAVCGLIITISLVITAISMSMGGTPPSQLFVGMILLGSAIDLLLPPRWAIQTQTG